MREVTFTRALNEAITEEMSRDDSVFLIGEDIVGIGGVYGTYAGVLKRFGPERIRQTPLSEAAFTGLAVGAAMAGLRPVVEIMYVDFVTVCWDMIANQAAKLRYMSGGQVSVPMVIRAPQGGGTKEAAHHSQCLEAWFAHTPGLKVVMPSSPADAKGLLKSAIRDNNPVIFLEHKQLYGMKGPLPPGEHVIPLGQADVKREGSDVTVVATSWMVQRALEAAERLADEVSVELVDPRTLVPLDMETIAASVRKTGRLLIVQEACVRCGFGGEILRRVCEECFASLRAAPRVLGGAEVPMPFSPPLEDACIPSVEQIAEAVRVMVG